MISLETAKRLKEAGLEWKVQLGDSLYFHVHIGGEWAEGFIETRDIEYWEETQENIEDGNWIFAPSLDQLLKDIEKAGYLWTMGTPASLETMKHEGDYMIGVIIPCGEEEIPEDQVFISNSRDEAAAEARIWILEQGVQGCET